MTQYPDKYRHIMVDIETTGTRSDHANMIQLSAVRFNPENLEVDTNTFDRCLLPVANRYWCEDTRRWWATLPAHILPNIYSRMEDPAVVLKAFYDWARRDLDGVEAILWAKPTAFEWPFLESYFKQFNLLPPFAYWNAKDLRTFLAARGMHNHDRAVEFEGDAHNAIHDVFHQVKVLFDCLEKTGGYVDND